MHDELGFRLNSTFFCLLSWWLRYPQTPGKKGRHRGRLQVKGESDSMQKHCARFFFFFFFLETLILSVFYFILNLSERKRRCEEKRKARSLRLHPSEEGPAQPQVLATFVFTVELHKL